MRFVTAVLAACIALPVHAQTAAPQTEKVTVTGTRSREVLDKFVNALTTTSRMTGKVARWEDGVCPVTVGLKQKFAGFISQRVRSLAKEVGAPVNDKKDCKPNIEIVFTTTPQALVDGIRKQNDSFLGYADNDSQREALAKVTRPIQAWYLTATKDLRGNTLVDSSRTPPTEITVPDPYHNPPFLTVYTKQGAMSVTGGRLGDGLHTAFYHAIIVAEPAKLLDEEVGTLADYIALLSLTQLNSLDTCQSLPSIANLLARDCAPVKELTDNDRAYLKGLYGMGRDRNGPIQRDQISQAMQQLLGNE